MSDDHAASIDTTGRVAVGDSVTGRIDENGDRDWFAVELEAGKLYRFDLEGQSTDAGTLPDPSLYGIFDAGGVFIPGTTANFGGEGLNAWTAFRAPVSGTYYVAVGERTYHTGTYRLSVAETDLTTFRPDDYVATVETTGRVEVGGSVTGEIEAYRDIDWFAVELEAGKTYRIDLEGSETGAGTLPSPYVRGVYDADGAPIAGTTNNNGGSGRNSRVTFTPAESGTYYISAEGSSWHYDGTYTLSVTEDDGVVPDDFTDDAGTTGTVAVGGSVTGEIEAHRDVDWFAVELEAGTAYRIDLTGLGEGDGTLRYPVVNGVRNAAGDLVAGSDGYHSAREHRLDFTATESGIHYIAVKGYERYGLSYMGTYTLSVKVGEDDHPAGTGTTGEVTVGETAMGEIERLGDVDWFTVELEAGRAYQIDLEGKLTGAGTLHDPYLYGIHNAGGTLIAGTTDDYSGVGPNSRVMFTPENDGTYYIAAGAGAHRVSAARMGTYRLSVTDVTPDTETPGGDDEAAPTGAVADDFTADTGTTGTVSAGGQAAGEIEETGDTDWFAVELVAGKTYRIDLEGKDSGAGTLRNPILHGLYDASGTLIADTGDNNGGDGADARLTYAATASGTHYLAAGGVREHAGTYRVSVEEVAVEEVTDDFTADTGTTGTVSAGGQVAGEIEEAGDADWFAVELEAGTTYRIDLEGKDSGAGTLRNPILHGLYDTAGTLIAGTGDNNGGDGANALLTYTATASGTHYLAAGGVREHAGTYRVSVTEVTDEGGAPGGNPGTSSPPAEEETAGADTDDFAADTGTSGRVAVGDSATGRIHERYDADWFAVELEAGQRYRVDLEGADTGAGTLANPFFRGVLDAGGDLVAGTRDNNGGEGRNSLVHFTAEESGTHYLVASAAGRNEGTYRLSIEEAADVL